MSTITKERVAEFIKNPLDNGLTRGEQMELARIALASLELERGMIRRFDLDMSDCDSCGQDCGADMVEDLDGEYVLWDEVLPHLYRHDEYTAPPAQVYDEDLLNMAASAIDDLLSNKDRSGAGVWADIPAKLRRAAMLQGAEPDFREISNSSTKNFRENAETSTKCWCHTCRPVTFSDSRLVVCPECGNKRCPHANDHRNACTGSNEPGQEGSAYPAAPQQEVK